MFQLQAWPTYKHTFNWVSLKRILLHLTSHSYNLFFSGIVRPFVQANNPVQIGRFQFEDRKILKVLSPVPNCASQGSACGVSALEICCEGLSCTGTWSGTCEPDLNCLGLNEPCHVIGLVAQDQVAVVLIVLSSLCEGFGYFCSCACETSRLICIYYAGYI